MQNEPAQFDLSKYLQIIKRRKVWIILPALCIIIGGSLYAFVLPPLYQSSGTILIEVQQIPTEFVRSLVTSYAENRIQVINQRIMSSKNLQDIINDHNLNLYADLKAKKSIEEIINQMRKDIGLNIISRGENAAIAFKVSYQYEDPEKCQQVCNILYSLYLKENIKVRASHVKETSDFLEEEARKLNEEISELQKKLTEFKRDHMGQLPELMDLNLQTVMRLDSEIVDKENQISVLQDRKAYFEGQLAVIDPYASPIGKTGEKILPNSERLKILKIEYSKASAHLSPEHPDMKSMKRAIESLEKEIEEEGNSSDAPQTNSIPDQKLSLQPDNPAYINLQTQIVSSELEIEALKRSWDDLKKQRDMYQKRIEMTPQVEKGYTDMKIRLDNTMKKYNDILSKSVEASVSMGLEEEQKGERFTMLDPPNLPTKPFKPDRNRIVMLSLVLGLGAGAGFGAAIEFMDDTIRSESDLIGTPYKPVLSTIPVIEGETRMRARKWKWKWIIFIFIALCLIGLGLLLFHLYVMDLEIFWIRSSGYVMRRIKRWF